jgi:DNA-binding XRE family transcriptional regulator
MGPDRPKQQPEIASRSFTISGSTFDEVKEFVRGYLEGGAPGSRGVAEISAAVAQAAGQGVEPVYVNIRVFTEHVEVTVGPHPVPGMGFREWFAVTLRSTGLSQEAAARRLGVSLKTVNRWLRGHSEPRMRELRRVREEFGQPPLA